MTPLAALKAAVAEFKKRNLKFCLAGGHAASLYRANERLTRDVDFVLTTDPLRNANPAASQVIRAIGLKPILGFIPKRQNKKGGKIALVSSTPEKGCVTGIIDILLPEQPWIEDALIRAQFNVIDLGFDIVPVITPEDLIIAKCYALNDSPDRFQDMDDIKEIFSSVAQLDLDYISMKLDELKLRFPDILASSVPKRLRGFLTPPRKGKN